LLSLPGRQKIIYLESLELSLNPLSSTGSIPDSTVKLSPSLSLFLSATRSSSEQSVEGSTRRPIDVSLGRFTEKFSVSES